MDAVLLDTTVASLLNPGKRRSTLYAWYKPRLQGKVLALSFQSVAELWAWAVENKWGPNRRRGLQKFMRRFLVVPFDFELAKVWAEVTTHCKQRGRRLEAGDAWIVATSVQRGLSLFAHDGDLLGLEVPGLRVVSALVVPGEHE